jgi:phospholipid transport system substrate-binding protein
MLTRRNTLLLGAAAVATLVAAPQAWAQDATGFVVNLGNQLTAVVNGPGSYEEKKRRLEPLIEQAVDVDTIAQFCLGLYWRRANPQQQQEFVRLFHTVLMNNIGGKLGQFQGVTFRPTTTTQREGDSVVGTVIQRPNQQPNNVQWVVSTASGRPKIIDVQAEGVSLRLTQRNDYSAYISGHGGSVDALLAAMRHQAGTA